MPKECIDYYEDNAEVGQQQEYERFGGTIDEYYAYLATKQTGLFSHQPLIILKH